MEQIFNKQKRQRHKKERLGEIAAAFEGKHRFGVGVRKLQTPNKFLDFQAVISLCALPLSAFYQNIALNPIWKSLIILKSPENISGTGNSSMQQLSAIF